jgi:transposase
MSDSEEKLKAEVYVLKERVAQLERLLFSAKRERFVSETPSNQGTLFDLESAEEVETEVVEKVVKSVKKKPKDRQGIRKNEFPAGLRREQTIIEPVELTEETADDFVKIGEDIIELLAYTPAEIHVKQIIRPRYAQKEQKETEKTDEKDDQSIIVEANIPPRLIPKGMVDESLLAQLIVEKIQFHTPIHRFAKKLKQLGIGFLKANNLTNWFRRTAESLLPLYHLLQADVLATAYVQADETRIQVLSKLKKNASHRGQMWVYFAPNIKATFFNYEPTRSTEAAEVILDGYQGIIQSDGYSVYQKIGQQQSVDIIHCMAHARRKFFEAKDNEPKLVNFILSKIQYLYKIEQQARDEI